MPRDKCGSCGAPIMWKLSAAHGRPMPLNKEPDPKGNVVLKAGVAVVLGNGAPYEEMMDGPKYMPHHATCPNAAKHRKPK